MVTVGGESGNNERGKKCQETQAGQAFQSLDKNCISFISYIGFIGASAAGLTPPPCLNSMDLKNKKYNPCGNIERSERAWSSTRTFRRA